MSIQKFIDDPVSYTKSHVVVFSGSVSDTGPAAVGMTLAATHNNWGGAWQAEYYTRTPGLFTDFRFLESQNKKDSSYGHRIGKGPAKMHTVAGLTSNTDKGVRFLPWKPDHMTFMEIDANAMTFFTGPLSGCAIYIGQAAAGGNYWAFHANRNSTGAVNNAMKTVMLSDTLPLVGTQVNVLHVCHYGQHYHDYGFIIGQKKAGQWEFYVADTRTLGGGLSATVVTKLS